MTRTPEQVRDYQREYQREWQRRQRQDPEAREKLNETVRRSRAKNPGKAAEYERRKRQDPLVREAQNASARERGKKNRAENPEKYREHSRRYRETHREQLREASKRYAQRSRNSKLLLHYGITAEQYAALLKAQAGGCAVCGVTPEPGGKYLVVDHDHGCCPGRKTCGKCIRGLLCDRHNRAFGFFNDDIAQLQAAIGYLQRPYWAGQVT